MLQKRDNEVRSNRDGEWGCGLMVVMVGVGGRW